MIKELDITDIAILRFAQGDIALQPRPYAALAASLGISEEEICDRLIAFLDAGLIRRFGAILRHQKAGFSANAMVVWKINCGDQEKAAAILKASDAVSHLYSRPDFPGWPANLFSMIHARDEAELERLISSFEEALGEFCKEHRLFPSVREFKKTSMKYFSEVDDD